MTTKYNRDKLFKDKKDGKDFLLLFKLLGLIATVDVIKK